MSVTEKLPEGLLDQYLTGTISEADRQVLMDWFDRFSDDQVSVLLSTDRSKEAVREELWAGIQKRTAQAARPDTEEKQVIRKGRWRSLSYRYTGVAAACILVVVAALSWWAVSYFGTPGSQLTKKGEVQTQSQSMDHNGAILTLSNGQQVTLDSAGTGQIARQGSARIVQKGGQISYLNTGDEVSQQAVVLNTMTTPRGKQYSLILPDGTKVWLNAASSITYPVQFEKDSRSVSVTGEVYFEVAHKTAADQKTRVPFLVRSGQLQVKVLGTHFDIQNYLEEHQIKTTLLEGSVALQYGVNGPEKSMVPGQQATLNRAGPVRISLNEVDTKQAIAWKDGLFFFKDEPLSDILKQVARWYDVETSADPSKTKLRFSGVISKRADLRDLLDVLSATGVVQFNVSENKVYGF